MRSIKHVLLGALAVHTACFAPKPPIDPPVTAGTLQPDRSQPLVVPKNLLAQEKTVVEVQHGVAVADPYRWLEDATNPAVAAWTDAQDDYARAYLARLPGRSDIVSRVRELLYLDERSAPLARSGRMFFWLKSKDAERAVYYWQETPSSSPKTLIDLNSAVYKFMAIDSLVPSRDGRLVAYKLRQNNMDRASLRVMEVDSSLPREVDTIPHAISDKAQWAFDGSGFYYVWAPDDPKLSRSESYARADVRFHAIGTGVDKDYVVWPSSGDPGRVPDVSISEDGRFLFVYIERGFTGRDVYVGRVVGNATKFEPLEITGSISYAVANRGRIFLLTNSRASRFEVFAIDPDKLDQRDWLEIVPERPDVVIDDIYVSGDFLVLRALKRASHQLEIRDLTGRLLHVTDGLEMGTISDVVPVPGGDAAFFTFESFSRPQSVFRISLRTGDVEPYSGADALVEASHIVTEQVVYASKDGTPISMFLAHRKDAPRAQTTKTLLVGYGGANIPSTPKFDPRVVAWIERGGLFALPNLRGGGEYGEEWHRGGTLANKQNVFDDFIAAAEWLIGNGYTQSRFLAIRGGSNGGLLVGAALTQRPELFSAVVCAYPLLDMVRYHLFGPARTWIPEYGNPEVAEDFKWLFGYSPYHHVDAQASYPGLLVLTADSDDRVDPLHARKFVAAMQRTQTPRGPSLLRVERNSSHRGASARNLRAIQVADELAFISQELSR